MPNLDSFYTKLSKRKNTLTVFNPYRDETKLENLKRYIELAFEQSGPRVLLVGEAYGFKGGRLTGIPFSSGKLFDEVDHPFLRQLKPKIELNPDTLTAENTASIVWRYLCSQNTVPLFWNSFPYHPHPSRIQKKNRAPLKAEIEEGLELLQMLMDVYQPDAIAGLGRKGTDCLQKAFPDQDIRYIRHPSYGGKSDFIDGMNRLFLQGSA